MAQEFKIVDMKGLSQGQLTEAAQVLLDAFTEMAPDAWETLKEARAEVKTALQRGKIARAAVDDAGHVIGWIGGIRTYDGNVWEMHPLAVRPELQKRGAGRALVADLEERVRERKGLTVYLGTDDTTGMTSLTDPDIYTSLWEKVRDIKNLRGHPFEFYQKLGYTIVGILPDANGIGRPDIFMAKRVRGA